MPGTTAVERGGNPRGKKIPHIPTSPLSSIALASLQQRHFSPFLFPFLLLEAVNYLSVHWYFIHCSFWPCSKSPEYHSFFPSSLLLFLHLSSSSPSPLRFLHLHSSWLTDSWPTASSKADLSHVPLGSLSPCPWFLPSRNEWNIPFLLQVTNPQMYQHSLQIPKIPCPSQPEQSCPSTLSELSTCWLGKRTSHFYLAVQE